MFKRISTCIGVLKRKHKVLLLDFAPRPRSFFSPALAEHWSYIWLLLYPSVLAKVSKTRLHIRETKQWPIFSIQITKYHKTLILHFLCPRSWLILLPSYPRPWKLCKSTQLVNTMYIYCSKDAKFISLNCNWNQILHSSSAMVCPRPW